MPLQPIYDIVGSERRCLENNDIDTGGLKTNKRNAGSIIILVLASILYLMSILAQAEEVLLTLDQQQAEVLKGKKLKLTAQITGTDEKVKYSWESADPQIADVKNGNVTGKRAGETVIICRTALSDGNSIGGFLQSIRTNPRIGHKGKKEQSNRVGWFPVRTR